MEENLWVKILLAAIGIFATLGSICNWIFFFENRKAIIIVKLFGRNGDRLFYSVLGIIIISMSTFFIN